MKTIVSWQRLRERRGATVIFVAIAMILLLGMAALAVDVGYVYVVRGELQNAADSGALAGTQVLYNANGTQVNAGANGTAQTYVQQHYSEQAAVQIQSIERGHWAFGLGTLAKGFYPNNSTNPTNLWNVSTTQLDEDTNFINAVRVITHRKQAGGTGAYDSPFFAQILGGTSPAVTATAVAYIGFAGTLTELSMDQPIAICKQAITDAQGNYTCGVGRMINSGSNGGHQTGGWTNFTQGPCSTASASSVKPLVCQSGGANPGAIFLGQGMGTVGGMQQNVYDSMLDCWTGIANFNPQKDPPPTQPWKMTLPVIDCPGNNTGNCSTVVGAVTINVIWITRNDKNQMNEVPRKMAGWPPVGNPLRDVTTGKCNGTGLQCWNSFVSFFQLQDVLNGTAATYEDKTLYFLPDCTPHDLVGTTGGENYGILAKIPVLVR